MTAKLGENGKKNGKGAEEDDQEGPLGFLDEWYFLIPCGCVVLLCIIGVFVHVRRERARARLSSVRMSSGGPESSVSGSTQPVSGATRASRGSQRSSRGSVRPSQASNAYKSAVLASDLPSAIPEGYQMQICLGLETCDAKKEIVSTL